MTGNAVITAVEANNGKAIEIKAQIPAVMHAEKIVLAYRKGSDGDFLAREMQPIESAEAVNIQIENRTP